MPVTDGLRRVDAGTLEVPLEPLVWADGSTLAGVRPFSLRMFQMHEALQEPGASASAHLDLLRLCVPDGATWTRSDGTTGIVDEDYRLDLSGPRVFLVFEHAQFKLKQMVAALEEARKNGDAGVSAASPLPPSSPTTSSSSPSPASRAPSRAAGAGSTTRTRRSTKSSTPSIG